MNVRIPAVMTTAFLLAAGAQGAHAGSFSYEEIDPANQSDRAGRIHAISTTYDSGTSTFGWDYTIDEGNDSFWLVVSPGDNPKYHAGEFAILFGDLVGGDLWAYEYSGQNNANSWRPGRPGVLIDSWENAITTTATGTGRQDVSFEIDVSTVNGHTPSVSSDGAVWEGIRFGPQLGLWFHPAINANRAASSFLLNEPGDVSSGIGSYFLGSAGWRDAAGLVAAVPEPALPALLVLGGLAMGGAARRRARAV